MSSVKQMLNKVETIKKRMAKELDKLSTLYDEIEDLLDSFDSRVEEIDYRIRMIRDGIDRLSEQV